MIRKLCDRVSCGRTHFRVLMKQWIFCKIFMGGVISNFDSDGRAYYRGGLDKQGGLLELLRYD